MRREWSPACRRRETGSVTAVHRPIRGGAAALLVALAAALASPAASGQTGEEHGAWSWQYAGRRLEIRSPSGEWVFKPQIRVQTRYSSPFDDPPRTVEALEAASSDKLAINRSRFKMDVRLGRQDLSLYTETELDGPTLLDLRVTWQPAPWLGVRVGQWKPEYNRERRDSSGEQQFVERSIVNREFTIDRQQGIMLSGRVGAGRPADVSWWAGVLGGGGRGSGNDGGRPMYMARAQWNPLGRVLGFSQSDIARRTEPALSVAVAAVDNRSRYTRFSSDGGGQLDGFEPGEVDQYQLRQWLFETALHWRGFSWQQEWHQKRVTDRLAGTRRELRGFYAQAGHFVSESWAAWPVPLELTLRYAVVDPDRRVARDTREEWTVAGNWFFDGHRNKLTADLSRLGIDDPTGSGTAWRVRLQWDFSF
jgi:phosphate-selective porin OprO/OprP